MRTNETVIIKVAGYDVKLKKLGHRMYHYSTVVDGQYVSTAQYSRFHIHAIRKEIEAVKK
jgi:hypothetical protein